MKKLALVLAMVLGILSPAFAQDTSLLATNRKVAWTDAGATIIDRQTTPCATINPYNGGPGTINTAIAGCTNGVVKLAAGTFTLNDAIQIGHSNVTLRGAGPDQTKIVFTGAEACGGLWSVVCIKTPNSPFPPDSPRNRANWTAGFSKGGVVITLSTVANLVVGQVIILDQLDDATPDINAPVNCANRLGSHTVWCSGEGAGNLSMDTQRLQNETHRVTAINGNNVTIEPGLAWPNWTISKTPQAWWGTDKAISGIGIENLKIDATSETTYTFVSSSGGILFNYVQDSWVKNIEIFKMSTSQIKLYESFKITIRDSYIHTSKTQGSTAYGILWFYSSYCLAENNILQDIVGSMLLHGVGNVLGYNYTLDNTYNPDPPAPFPPGNFQMQAGLYLHNGGGAFNLIEGAWSNSFKADAIHGTSNFSTVFRAYLWGFELLKERHIVPIFVYAWNRYFNIVNNVLGTAGVQDVYSTSFYEKTIYRLGETPNNCPWGGGFTPDCTVNDIGSFTDSRVASTMFRWGNWDTKTNGTKFDSAEVPSGLGDYPQAEPGSHAMPNSFYKSGQPSWWATAWGTPAWPPIGQDVTGGAESGVGGHVNAIPAVLCYRNQSKTGGNPNLLNSYNGDECYSAGSSDVTLPSVTIGAPNGGNDYVASSSTLTTLTWTASDDSGTVSSCTGTSDVTGSFAVTGTTSGSAASVTLLFGDNNLTIRCVDPSGNANTDSIKVTLPAPIPIRRRSGDI